MLLVLIARLINDKYKIEIMIKNVAIESETHRFINIIAENKNKHVAVSVVSAITEFKMVIVVLAEALIEPCIRVP
jgi:translation initiation factor 1 (eIF-1/SUI1)